VKKNSSWRYNWDALCLSAEVLSPKLLQAYDIENHQHLSKCCRALVSATHHST
jgi:hypothetical protein